MATLMGNAASVTGFTVAGTALSAYAFRWELTYEFAEHDVSRFGDLGVRTATSIVRARARIYIHSDGTDVSLLPVGAGTGLTLKLYQESGQSFASVSGGFYVTNFRTEAMQINGAPSQAAIYEGPLSVTATSTLPVSNTT